MERKALTKNMENNTLVQHQNIGQKYRMVIERAASTKGVLGYKIEVNGDMMTNLITEMELLKAEAERIAGATLPMVPETK